MQASIISICALVLLSNVALSSNDTELLPDEIVADILSWLPLRQIATASISNYTRMVLAPRAFSDRLKSNLTDAEVDDAVLAYMTKGAERFRWLVHQAFNRSRTFTQKRTLNSFCRLFCEEGILHLIERCIRHYQFVDVCALQKTIQNSHTDVVEQLLANGAVHAPDNSALRLANENGYTEIISQLLGNGANVNG